MGTAGKIDYNVVVFLLVLFVNSADYVPSQFREFMAIIFG